MLTEAEAKMHWCPLARVTGTGGVGGNRYPMEDDAPGIAPFARCIGSACMAWRTVEPKPSGGQRFGVILDGKPEETWFWDPRGSDAYRGRVAVREMPAHEVAVHGYCGAFGRPG